MRISLKLVMALEQSLRSTGVAANSIGGGKERITNVRQPRVDLRRERDDDNTTSAIM